MRQAQWGLATLWEGGGISGLPSPRPPRLQFSRHPLLEGGAGSVLMAEILSEFWGGKGGTLAITEEPELLYVITATSV